MSTPLTRRRGKIFDSETDTEAKAGYRDQLAAHVGSSAAALFCLRDYNHLPCKWLALFARFLQVLPTRLAEP
jgi:hypothetical protein